MNKNSNALIQGILALAVIVLFVLHFTGSKNTSSSVASSSVSEAAIAYVNMDSLIVKLDMWADMQTALSDQQTKYDNELSTMQKNFQNKVTDLNNKVQKMLITSSDAQTQAERLQTEEQNLYSLADEYQQRLAEQNAVNTNQVISALNDFLKEFNADGRFQFVLASSFGGQVLYAQEQFDITNEVVEGMNAQYKSSK